MRRRGVVARRRLVRRRRVGAARLSIPRRLNVRTGGFLGLELKFSDEVIVNDAFATTWATMTAGVDVLSGVAQGDGEIQRDGRKYLIHSISVKLRVHAIAIESATAPDDDLHGRFALVLDTQTNGAQLTATDVMVGSTNEDRLSFRNLQQVKRFRVLWDRSFLLKRQVVNEGAANLFATNLVSTPIIRFTKIFSKPVEVICTGTGAAVSAISNNSIHMIGIANNTLALLSYQSRIRFTG